MSKPELLLWMRCDRRDYDVIDLEEAVMLAEFSEVAAGAFAKRQLQVPDWLLNQSKALTRFIKVKSEEALEAQLKRLEARRTQLMTPTEQRESLDVEIAALRAAIGGN